MKSSLIPWVLPLALGLNALPTGRSHSQSAGQANRAEFLIEPVALKSESTARRISILDVREKGAFSKAHIPSAVWVDVSNWRSKSAEKFGLKDADFWSKELGRLGVDDQLPIVVVGDVLTESARAWWVLKYLGMNSVRLLDGGMSAWTSAKLETTADTLAVHSTQPKIAFQLQRLAELADVLPQARDATQCQIVDNRSLAEYDGSRGLGGRAGHIPSAKHLEWKSFVDDAGRILPNDQLKSLLDDHKIDLAKPVITHCQTGGRSSVGALVAEMLGGKHVRNYVLGWSEYAGQLQAPVE